MRKKDETIAKRLVSSDNDEKIVALYTLLHETGRHLYLDELAQCMISRNLDIKFGAIMVLSKIRSRNVVPILKNALKDQNVKIRINAALGLARLGEKSAIPTLKWIVKNDYEDHSVHKRAIEALGLFKKENLLPVLGLALRHRRKLSRIKAIHAIAKISSKKSVSILKKALSQEEDPAIKDRISRSLRALQRNG